MNKEQFLKILECVLLKFDNETDGNLLLKNGFSYHEIENAKKILEFIGGLKK